ncbi:hypothetical protein Krac_0661 [Ktedonobacter racemifer DSM 44963]|uniref:Uncharacterized protein n=1 Tax=Ktedonobacter racemifer DSM 44963 TaxID=485913 RepID=D6U897_KTERA|nr:hypothetical protein Krac_0661 [Ktedonobacter racemifer DSM 44963]
MSSTIKGSKSIEAHGGTGPASDLKHTDDVPVVEGRPVDLIFLRGGEASLAGLRFALISILLFLVSCISAVYARQLADSLYTAETYEVARINGYHYWDVPGFNWQGCELGLSIGVFCLLVGAGVMIAALISSYASLNHLFRARERRVRRLVRWSMILSHLCILLLLLALGLVTNALLRFSFWMAFPF